MKNATGETKEAKKIIIIIKNKKVSHKNWGPPQDL
jgi:hypothetical protein